MPDADVTPNSAHELLARLPDVDGFRLHKVTEKEIPLPGALVLVMAETPEQRARREIDADLADSAEVVKSNETVGFGNY